MTGPGPFPFRSPANFRPFVPGSVGPTTVRTITSKARITAVANQTITSKANIGSQTLQTITSKARLSTPTTKTITSKARISKGVTKTITSVARLSAQTLQTLTSKARLTVPQIQTITSKARLSAQTLRSITSKARIGTPNLSIMPGAAPDMTVAYGGFKLDESAGCILTSEYRFEDSATDGGFYIEFRVRLTPGTETRVRALDDQAFAALVLNAETQLRIPRQRLLVQIRGVTYRDWNYDGVITAITIAPELRLLQANARDYHYGLWVRCGYPGNVPGNFFRRESVSGIGIGLATRRLVTIEGIWTASSGVTAYAQYQAQGDTFFAQQLQTFPNTTDQFGTTGTWAKADEQPRDLNDEASLIRASRVYAEVFAGRRDSDTVVISSIAGRRVCTIAALYYASPGFTSYQNFANNASAFFGATLNTPQCVNVAGGQWILVESRPSTVDNAGTLQVRNTYHEVVNGLREFTIKITSNLDQTRRVEISGTFYGTPQAPAQQNYLSGINGIVQFALQSEGIAHSESKSVPKELGYDTTGLRYFFKWTVNELQFPQGPLGYDDPAVVMETLWVRLSRPFDAQAMTQQNQVTRLQVGTADFHMTVDTTASGGLDPTTLWDQRFRAFVESAAAARLGGLKGALTVQIYDEEVNHTDTGNQFWGRIKILVTGGSILSLYMEQTLSQVPPLDLTGMGDGTSWDYQAWRDLPEKTITRLAICEFVVGAPGTPPVLFGSGDNLVSGTTFIDTGRSAQDDFDLQVAGGAYTPATNWMLDRRQPFVNKIVPSERGDGGVNGGVDFQTAQLRQLETWRYVLSVNVDPLS